MACDQAAIDQQFRADAIGGIIRCKVSRSCPDIVRITGTLCGLVLVPLIDLIARQVRWIGDRCDNAAWMN